MQGNGGRRDPFFDAGDPFAGLGGFGGQGSFAGLGGFGRQGSFAGLGGFGGQSSLLSGFLGGRNPFDDPFFTRPFGGMFEPGLFGPTGSPFMDAHASGLFGPTGSPFMDTHASGLLEHQSSQPNRVGGPIIEELNSDEEKEEVEGGKEKKDNPRMHGRPSKEPYVEDPDDAAEVRKSKQMQYRNEHNSMSNTQSHPQARCFSFQSSSVTYGGSNGAYYTSSRTRRTGSDGLTIEESKEADSATGQAAHRLSRGIHDKGHTVKRKLNSDGRVDTMQTLHNLNEDELAGFEEAWKGNATKHLPGWTEGNAHDSMGSGSSAWTGPPSRGGWALPSTERSHNSGRMKPDIADRAASSRSPHSGRMRADAEVRTGSSQVRSRGAGTNKRDQVKRH